jgi:hypothetical protein
LRHRFPQHFTPVFQVNGDQFLDHIGNNAKDEKNKNKGNSGFKKRVHKIGLRSEIKSQYLYGCAVLLISQVEENKLAGEIGFGKLEQCIEELTGFLTVIF